MRPTPHTHGPGSRMFGALLAGVLAPVMVAMPADAQEMEDVQIRTVPVANGIFMLEGRGGNIGVSIGDDGVFLVDDQYAPLTAKIIAAVNELTREPIRFVINTHWHGDHTGGNENLGNAGAIVVAHENVRKRMSTEQFMEAFDRRVPASPADALPVITFSDIVTFHWNDDEIRVFHVDPAHTDGDAMIHFTRANVLHMGDTYFNGSYPFIDVSAGGSIAGMIRAVDKVLAEMPNDIRIIPGHGPLSGLTELRTYRTVLVTVRDRIQRLVNQGRTRGDVIAAKPTADFDNTWGGGFMQPDQWVGIIYDSITRQP